MEVGSPEYVKIIKSIQPKIWEGLNDKNIGIMFRKKLHIKFEKADNENNIAFFEEVKKKGWMPYLHAHYEATKESFDWSNYEMWIAF